MIVRLALLLVAGTALAEPPKTDPAKAEAAEKASALPKLIVLEPRGTGVSETLLRVLDEVILTELGRDGRFEVLGSSDVKNLLSLAMDQQRLGCDTAADACMAEIGGALGAQFLASTSVSKLDALTIVNMKLLDVTRARAVARKTEQFEGSQALLVEGARRMALTLVEPPAAPGRTWTWIAFGGAALSFAAGGWLGWSGDSLDRAARHTITQAEAQAYNERLGLANGLLVAGGVLTVAGAALYFIETPGGAAVGLSGKF